jgi:hypothetical protein
VPKSMPHASATRKAPVIVLLCSAVAMSRLRRLVRWARRRADRCCTPRCGAPGTRLALNEVGWGSSTERLILHSVLQAGSVGFGRRMRRGATIAGFCPLTSLQFFPTPCCIQQIEIRKLGPRAASRGSLVDARLMRGEDIAASARLTIAAGQ